MSFLCKYIVRTYLIGLPFATGYEAWYGKKIYDYQKKELIDSGIPENIEQAKRIKTERRFYL